MTANLHLCWHGGDWNCGNNSMGEMSYKGWTYFCHQRRYFKFVTGEWAPGSWGSDGYAQYRFNAQLRAETQGE